MKIKAITTLILLFIIPCIVVAGIYQCEDIHGRVSFQSQPCTDSEAEKVIESLVTSISEPEPKSDPSGYWKNQANDEKLKARISKSGIFEMIESNGDKIKGKWEQPSFGYFTVEAKLEGVSLVINMKYDEATETLYLSKPGSPREFRKLDRR